MKTIRGSLIGFDQVWRSEEARLVDITLRVMWSPGDFDLQIDATYLLAFERAYERPPEIVAPASSG